MFDTPYFLFGIYRFIKNDTMKEFLNIWKKEKESGLLYYMNTTKV